MKGSQTCIEMDMISSVSCDIINLKLDCTSYQREGEQEEGRCDCWTISFTAPPKLTCWFLALEMLC